MFRREFFGKTIFSEHLKKISYFQIFFWERSSFILCLKNKIIFSGKRNIIFPDNTRKVIFQCDFFGNTIFSKHLEKENMVFRAVLILGVSKKICFCIYAFKMRWYLGDDHSPRFFFFLSSFFLQFQYHLRHWIGTLAHLGKLPYEHFSVKITLWSFCACVRLYKIIIFRYKTTFWFLRFEAFRDLSKYVSCQNKLIGGVILKCCSL